MHGGISPAVAALGCEGINDTVRNELKELPADGALLSTFLSTREDGPLWYRGLAAETEATFASELTTMLARLQARALVIGHTVSPNGRIATRFDGRVVQIDTGMLGGMFIPVVARRRWKSRTAASWPSMRMAWSRSRFA